MYPFSFITFPLTKERVHYSFHLKQVWCQLQIDLSLTSAMLYLEVDLVRGLKNW